jgi:hypothetical protein
MEENVKVKRNLRGQIWRINNLKKKAIPVTGLGVL